MDSFRKNSTCKNQAFLVKIITILLFSICFVFGVFMSIYNYKNSVILNVYWLLSCVLLFLFIYSKIYLKPIRFRQIVCLIPIVILYLLGWLLITHTLKFGMFLFSTVCFLYVGTLFIHHKFTRYVFLIALIVSSFNLAALLFYISERSTITREIINTIFISNPHETKEYLYGKISIVHIVILLLFISSVSILFFQKKKIENSPAQKLNILVVLLFIISYTISSYSGPLGALSVEYYQYKRYQDVLKDMIADRSMGLSGTSFTINNHENEARKIVVIIGESTNRNYMSLYGYGKDTNPRLSKLMGGSSKGKLFVFSDIISPEVTTMESLRKVLTTINNDNNIELSESVSVVDLFKKAAFQTYWLSNQIPLRDYDSPISFIGAAADTVLYTSQLQRTDRELKTFKNHYDGKVLDNFKNYILNSTKETKQIYFIHLQGSHFDYKDRYPESFHVFQFDESQNESNYLNSILYNDWVVNQIIEISNLADVDVVCYFADHGEDLKYNHNPENYTKNMSMIPFMIYLSKSYMKLKPGLVESLLKHKDAPGISDNFIHDLQYLTGVKSSLYDSTLTFLTEYYKKPSKRIVNNTSFD